tara:strand:+ start:19533 stop:21245 length:1713 start_codon:yes stop_codon:yes gene_type:complete
MLFRFVFVLCLISLLISCTAGLPKASEDGVVLTKEIKTTRLGEWANLHAQDLARWKIIDVDEYGYIPIDYFVYNDENRSHQLASQPLGVRTLTDAAIYKQKIVSGELAGKLEYWLAREINNTFYEKVHETKTFKPIYQPNPEKSGDVFYFQDTPAKDVVRFSAALIKSGIKEDDVPKIIKSCGYIKGWSTLTHLAPNQPDKYLTLYEIKQQRIRTQNFHRECFAKIIEYSPIRSKQHIDKLKVLPPTFNNSKYLLGGDLFTSYGENIIKQVIDYDKFNQGYYDAGFLAHLRGKYGMDIRENLKHNAVKSKLYKQAKPRVMVVLTDATQLLSELKFVNDQYFYTVKSHMNFTSHVVSKIFGKRKSKSLYLDYHSRVKSLMGMSQYGYHYEGQNVLSSLNGKCNFDHSKVQLASKTVSRFELDCLHAPIKTGIDVVDESDYQAYSSISSVQNAPNNVLSSSVTLFSLNDYGNIMGSVNTIGVNTAAIQFELERDIPDMNRNYFHAEVFGGLVNGRVDPLQPMSDLLSNFALTLAKNFPPSAIVSWIPAASQYGYAFHHGVLWRFPVSELRSD